MSCAYFRTLDMFPRSPAPSPTNAASVGAKMTNGPGPANIAARDAASKEADRYRNETFAPQRTLSCAGLSMRRRRSSGHGTALHSRLCTSSPSHGSPAEGSTWTTRERACVPVPHGLVHCAQSDQPDSTHCRCLVVGVTVREHGGSEHISSWYVNVQYSEPFRSVRVWYLIASPQIALASVACHFSTDPLTTESLNDTLTATMHADHALQPVHRQSSATGAFVPFASCGYTTAAGERVPQTPVQGEASIDGAYVRPAVTYVLRRRYSTHLASSAALRHGAEHDRSRRERAAMQADQPRWSGAERSTWDTRL